MKALAAVLYSPKERLRIEEVEVLPPQVGEVQVRMHAAGVCHSDLHVMKGDLAMNMPIILGHEGSGVVEAVGEYVDSVKPGDHVIPIWRMSCGVCEYCLSGRPALCDVGTKMRFTGLMPDGKTRFRNEKGDSIRHYAGVSTFSQLSTMPEGAVVKIDPEFPLEQAALISCGVITGFGAVFATAEVKPGSTVAVFGAGGIGLNVIQSARIAGATRIIAVDTFASKQAYAESLGATHFVNPKDGDPVAEIMKLTDGRGVDFSFEAIGMASTVEQAYDSVKKGGTCVVVGIAGPDERSKININSLVYAEKTLKGSIYGSTRPRIDLPKLMELSRSGIIELEPLLTKTYPLSEINEAYEALEKGEVARSLILPQT
ncbi:MAG: Zn-dependent alcohol dehydrogenase [Verrucomicrobiales bacterium]|nr:Zn-dependent alcohol dehydrogenase [Verrucomicrobiales bacterium]